MPQSKQPSLGQSTRCVLLGGAIENLDGRSCGLYRLILTFDIFSPHGIAMTNGLYFTAVVFLLSFLFSTHTVCGHWLELSQTWTHLLMTVICKLWSTLTRAFAPTGWGWGAKPLSLDRIWTLTGHISATEHDMNNRKETCQSTGTPLDAAKFGELWSRNGWERLATFCPPL